jgi:hypothetical protein
MADEPQEQGPPGGASVAGEAMSAQEDVHPTAAGAQLHEHLQDASEERPMESSGDEETEQVQGEWAWLCSLPEHSALGASFFWEVSVLVCLTERGKQPGGRHGMA